MDLHSLAGSQIRAVNPFVPASMQVSNGYNTAADGSRTPTFDTVTGEAQVQALSPMDLRQIDGLNLGGEKRSIYFHGEFNGVVRPKKKGGDLVTLTDGPNAGVWLIVMVPEHWPNWCHVIVVLQKDGA